MDPIKAVFTCGPATIHLEGASDEIQRCLETGSISKHLMSAAAATKSDPANLSDEAFEMALGHAWEWFSLHADHRMRSVNFFIVTIAFLTAAYVTSLRFNHAWSAAGICVVGLFLTICFWRFEVRIRELIKASEAALRPLQSLLASRTAIESLKIVDLVERPKACFSSYSDVIRALHITSIIMFIAGIFYLVALRYRWIELAAATS